MGASRQAKDATALAERLGKRHGVPYMLVSLSAEQHGVERRPTPAVIATLLAGEGTHLLAQVAEYPQLVPAPPAAAGRIARQLTRRLRSGEAERASVFLAHALLEFAEATYRMANEDGAMLIILAGKEDLRAHYPLVSDDASRLGTYGQAFIATPVGTQPVFSYAAPDFAGRATGYAIGLVLGSDPVGNVPMELPTMSNPTVLPHMLPLTQIWSDRAERQGRLLHIET